MYTPRGREPCSRPLGARPLGLGFSSRPTPNAPRPLLLYDPHPHFRLHVGVQADGDAVDAEGLDGVVEVDHPALDVEALLLELGGDVGGGHGAEQLALLADPRREGEGDLLELRGELLRLSAPLILGGLETAALLLEPLLVALRRLVGEAARQEE